MKFPSFEKFNHEEWETPHSFCSGLPNLPRVSAVYVITIANLSKSPHQFFVQYVGQSKNIYSRFKNHYAWLKVSIECVVAKAKFDEIIKPHLFYFPVPVEHLVETEKRLISSYNPPLNRVAVNLLCKYAN